MSTFDCEDQIAPFGENPSTFGLIPFEGNEFNAYEDCNGFGSDHVPSEVPSMVVGHCSPCNPYDPVSAHGDPPHCRRPDYDDPADLTSVHVTSTDVDVDADAADVDAEAARRRGSVDAIFEGDFSLERRSCFGINASYATNSDVLQFIEDLPASSLEVGLNTSDGLGILPDLDHPGLADVVVNSDPSPAADPLGYYPSPCANDGGDDDNVDGDDDDDSDVAGAAKANNHNAGSSDETIVFRYWRAVAALVGGDSLLTKSQLDRFAGIGAGNTGVELDNIAWLNKQLQTTAKKDALSSSSSSREVVTAIVGSDGRARYVGTKDPSATSATAGGSGARPLFGGAEFRMLPRGMSRSKIFRAMYEHRRGIAERAGIPHPRDDSYLVVPVVVGTREALKRGSKRSRDDGTDRISSSSCNSRRRLNSNGTTGFTWV